MIAFIRITVMYRVFMDEVYAIVWKFITGIRCILWNVE